MTRLKPNDVIIAFVSFVEGTGGKSRPVLVQTADESSISGLGLTSQYTNKSQHIKKQYYKIKDWQAAGLKKPTWIDIERTVRLPKHRVQVSAIGKLTDRDIEGLVSFIEKYVK
ncbi:type II toxin-antitoxin system PemK/MazF family toxin [Leuconostoc pseudomesenteroides]|uniref:type II toxin-antitoxin system PemK/MazF family toxin n=1 Tax=Leuconostoc pseudomesenteroides TaxID=33968 RepID=UPI00403DC4DB